MTTEEITDVPAETTPLIVAKVKNPKRVAAGKKGIEAKKLKAELKRKEEELLKKENMELKQITKDSDDDAKLKDSGEQKINVYKNYIPLCLSSIVVVGLGFYFYQKKNKSKIVEPPKIVEHKKEEYDPFKF